MRWAPQHHALACSRGLLRSESVSHKAKAAEFTGRARRVISSAALTPTARVARGPSEARNSPPAPKRAGLPALIARGCHRDGNDSAAPGGSLPRVTLSVAAGRARFLGPQAGLDKHSAEGVNFSPGGDAQREKTRRAAQISPREHS